MKLDNKKIFQTLNPNKVWVPILIGLAIIFAMFYFVSSNLLLRITLTLYKNEKLRFNEKVPEYL